MDLERGNDVVGNTNNTLGDTVEASQQSIRTSKELHQIHRSRIIGNHWNEFVSSRRLLHENTAAGRRKGEFVKWSPIIDTINIKQQFIVLDSRHFEL